MRFVLEIDQSPERGRKFGAVRDRLFQQRRSVPVVSSPMDEAKPSRADGVRRRDPGKDGKTGGDVQELVPPLLVQNELRHLQVRVRSP